MIILLFLWKPKRTLVIVVHKLYIKTMLSIKCIWCDTSKHKGKKLTRRPDCGFSNHIGPAQLLGTWWTHGMYLSHPRKIDHLNKKRQTIYCQTKPIVLIIIYHLQRCFLPISLTAKEHWYPQYIWVAPRPGKSKSLTKRGTISSFCSVWPRRP